MCLAAKIGVKWAFISAEFKGKEGAYGVANL